MATADDISKNFKALYKGLEDSSLVAVNKAAIYVREKLAAFSPVQSGRYQRSWRITRAKSGNGKLASSAVFNPIPYGYWIEEGADNPKVFPFWGSGPKTVTGSFWGSDMRIWSTSAKGGTIRKFMSGQQSSLLLDALSRDIIKGIKW